MAHPGRYKILRKIADGGMAEIFLATQRGAEGFERPVVLKRILAALVADPQFRNVMVDEAHVAMGLNHSNIAQVLDLGRAKGRYFLVLEFVDGWDLNQVLNRASAAAFPLPAELALYISAEVCRALAYAHHREREGKPLGIVHRDVTPHNVLLSEQGEVKLTDFGIAKALGRRERTGAGIIKGKLAFMSPEQASGTELDARSDLFAVGTMLYLMSTGRRPFEAPTDLEGILRVRQCDFPPPEAIKPDLEPKLAALIGRAMKKEPGQRFQSAEDMLVDLESVQRTVFQPAGQTELKRWLAGLRDRDGVPSIGRAAPIALDSSSDIRELVGGDLIFDDDPAPDQVQGALSEQTPVRAPPPMPRAGADAANAAAARVKKAPPPASPSSPPAAEPARGGRGRVYTLVALAATAVAGFFYLRLRPPGPEVAPRPGAGGAAGRPPGAPAPAPAPPTHKMSPAPVPRPPSASTPPPAPAPPAPRPPAAPVKTEAPKSAASPPGARPGAPPAEPEDPDDDEEALLKKAEPDADKKVIGEESAPPPPPPRRPVAASKEKDRPAPAPVKARPAEPARPPEPAVVSVNIVTRPEGAVVRLKDRVFGRAPLRLRFRPGIPFDLSFVKSGYLTRTRRYTFSKAANQSITVSLQKRPAPKRKGFFQRLFGK